MGFRLRRVFWSFRTGGYFGQLLRKEILVNLELALLKYFEVNSFLY